MGYSFDGICGMSPIHVARNAIGLGMAMEEFGSKFFKNDAKSGGVLMHPGKLNEKARTNIADSFHGQGGSENAHRVKVLEEGMKYVPTSVTSEDSQFLGSREFQLAEAARIYRVSLVLLSSLEGSTVWGTGIKQLMIGFVIWTLGPWLQRWQEELGRKLFTEQERKAGFYIKFNLNALLRGDMTARAAFYKAGITDDWMTRNEVRALEDRDDMAGFDEPLIQQNMQLASMPARRRRTMDRPVLTMEAQTLRTILSELASAAAPLALSPNWLDWLSATVKAIEARIDPRTERSAARKQGAVAVIPVFGVITPRPSILEYYGLAISTQTIGQRVREAVADPDVKAIVLDVDSPGGVISGVSELAAELRGLRGAKPIVAHADYLVASAAYWIAAQADEIIASPSALVGSVGVYSMHVDQSGLLEQLGIKVSLVAEPAEKIEGNPFEPLGEDAEAHMRGIISQGLATFRADVTAGRARSRPSRISWARVYTAKDAKAMGMVDKIRTLSETLGAYGIDQARATQAGRQRAAALREAQLDATLAELQSLGVSV